MDDPWGAHEPAAPHPDPPEPLPAALAQLAALPEPRTVEDWADWEIPGPEALPEVAALMRSGWRLLEADPRHTLLPAVWPSHRRCWLPDRMPKVYTSFDGRTSRIIPVGQACHPGPGRGPAAPDDAELAAEAGLPAPPKGRIWLLRSPWSWVGLKVVLLLIGLRRDELDAADSSGFVLAAREILGWDEKELRTTWTGAEADAARDWEALGRVGEDVVELVLAGIGPEFFFRMPGLSPNEAATWRCAAAGRTTHTRGGGPGRVLPIPGAGCDTTGQPVPAGAPHDRGPPRMDRRGFRCADHGGFQRDRSGPGRVVAGAWLWPARGSRVVAGRFCAHGGGSKCVRSRRHRGTSPAGMDPPRIRGRECHGLRRDRRPAQRSQGEEIDGPGSVGRAAGIYLSAGLPARRVDDGRRHAISGCGAFRAGPARDPGINGRAEQPTAAALPGAETAAAPRPPSPCSGRFDGGRPRRSTSLTC